MYSEFGDDSSDDENTDSTICVLDKQQKLSPQSEYNSNNAICDDIDCQFLSDQIDEFELKMKCLERIKIIQEDMSDPQLTPAERTVNQTNLNVLNSILTNVKLNEKLKLGSLHNGEYTDAILLQKQLVCNLAGQKECSEIVKPVTLTQVQPSSVPLFQDTISSLQFSTGTEDSLLDRDKETLYVHKERKSILKEPKNNSKIAVTEQ